MGIITAKIDVKKITKSRLYVGEKGTYLDIILIPTPNGKHGDYMIVESITKEERDAGKKGVILGNAKNAGGRTSPSGDFRSTLSNDFSDMPF